MTREKKRRILKLQNKGGSKNEKDFMHVASVRALCVDAGGCMAIPITSEKNVDGYVDLNVYPEIKEQKDRIIESILQECESKGEPLKDTNEYIGKPDIGSYIFVDFSNKERSFSVALLFDINSSDLGDIRVFCKSSILETNPNLFDTICSIIFKTDRFHLYDEEIEKVLEGKKEKWNIRDIDIELSITEDEKSIQIIK